MARPEILAGRARHTAAAVIRSAWFGAHYLAARRSAGEIVAKGERLNIRYKLPKLGDILGAIHQLNAADRVNVERGIYPAPEGPPMSIGPALAASRRFLADARKVADRRRAGGSQEAAGSRDDLPRYYQQNFHFQTDGYLSAESAALYDFQVETLFGGTAGPMRRQALPFLQEAIAGRDQRSLAMLEIACGTGALTAEVARAFPRLPITAVDPSSDYLARAERRLHGRPSVRFEEGLAEQLPYADGSFGLAASCYLFHELPPKIRVAVAGELKRVVKPGGLYVHLDTLQYGDAPRFDGLLDAFPQLFHEPYYASYAALDLAQMFRRAGFEQVGQSTGFLTKAVAFRRLG